MEVVIGITIVSVVFAGGGNGVIIGCSGCGVGSDSDAGGC